MNVCRLCLNNKTKEIVSIFNGANGDLPKKIEECVSIKISESDDLPNFICTSCLDHLNNWKIFRDCCYETQETLIQTQRNKRKIVKETTTDHLSSSIDIVVNKIYEENENNLQLVPDEVYIKKENEKTLIGEFDRVNSGSTNKVVLKEELDEIFDEVFYEYNGSTQNYKCEVCCKEFEQIFEYLDHQIIHNGEFVFKCERCSEVFSTREDLVEHDYNHKIPCEKCGILISKNSMKLHLIRHTDKHKCNECGTGFNSRSLLEQHIVTVHTKVKDYICELCGKEFPTKSSITVHMKTHSDVREYRCNQCDYAARTSSSLYIHRATHARESRICEYCSKSFKSLRNLKDHLRRVHTKDKKHECTFCSKKFVDKYMLTVHIRWHTGVRPFKCTVCEKTFVRQANLTEHMLIHGNRKTVECKTCGKKFASHRLLLHKCYN